jgi:hypothetical protein
MWKEAIDVERLLRVPLKVMESMRILERQTSLSLEQNLDKFKLFTVNGRIVSTCNPRCIASVNEMNHPV